MVQNWILAMLSFIYYWSKMFSKEKKNFHHSLKEWFADRVVEAFSSLIAVVIVTMILPLAYESAQHYFKFLQEDISYKLFMAIGSIISGLLASWILDKLTVGAKRFGNSKIPDEKTDEKTEEKNETQS
jgi:uncharacterized membrane protein (DUF106 family)